MRTAIVQAGLGAGGAEKVVNMLAHHRQECGDQVDVIAVNAASTESYFPYAEGVAVHALGAGTKGGMIGSLVRFVRLRRQLRALEPDLVVSFLTKVNVMVGVATVGMKASTIMSERNNFRAQKMNAAWRLLAWVVLGRAARLVMQTKPACASLPSWLRDRAVVIPNPVAPAPCRRKAVRQRTRFVAVGRLETQKGFDLLLEAFARASEQLPAASLVIFGEGPERAALQRLAEKLGIASKVDMPGRTQTPQEWLEAGSIFVLSSRFEGFPNVMLEALLTGMATVSFDCPWGPSEILRDEDGYPLVPAANIEALAAALVQVGSDPETRRRLEDMGPRVAARYSKRLVFAEWDRLIERTLAA